MFFRRLLKNDLTILLLRLALVYVILFFTQIVFYFYNKDIIGTISFSEFFVLLRGSFFFDNIGILYLNVLFIIMSLIPFRFRERKGYQCTLLWLYIIPNFLCIVVLNLSDAVYFHYAGKRFTIEELHFINNSNNHIIIWKALMSNWKLLLVGLLLLLGIWFGYKKIKYYPTNIKSNWIYYPVNIIILAAFVGIWVGGVRGGFSWGLRPYTLSNAAYYAKTPPKAYLILSNPMCIFKTLGIKPLDKFAFFCEKELEEIYSPMHHYRFDSVSFQKKNVVLFILESFSKEHSAYYCPHLYSDGQGFTPFLDSLMREGLCFFNAFANGKKSIDALPAILASIPSYKKPFVLMPVALGKMEGFPSILSKNGYETYFFCGAEKNSMGFESFAMLSGINNMISREDYEKKCDVNRLTVEPYWGIYDMPFLQFMASEMKQFQVPFFVSVFNLTSHHPFIVPENYVDKLPKGFTNIHQCVAYTDLAIRQFFEISKNEPWYNNTIFVFVADHVSSEIYSPETRTSKGNSAIFYFIFTPDNSIKGTYYNVTQQIDIMPTLLGLLHYEEPYFAFGRDFFNDHEKIPFATNFVGQTFQGISDSLLIYFDGYNTPSIYHFGDYELKNDIINLNDMMQKNHFDFFKAILQTYNNCLEKKDFLYYPSQY
ncbi:MAG: LTA synthase family protein [Bacteroidales bacterium]|jgi:phosphoglycerol transferase MdoB-like AlkP superfamily enzyme|nr:LTA synthase family protein [Bacteroidales bacterium]